MPSEKAGVGMAEILPPNRLEGRDRGGRFMPGFKGQGGRPKGSKNRKTLMAEAKRRLDQSTLNAVEYLAEVVTPPRMALEELIAQVNDLTRKTGLTETECRWVNRRLFEILSPGPETRLKASQCILDRTLGKVAAAEAPEDETARQGWLTALPKLKDTRGRT